MGCRTPRAPPLLRATHHTSIASLTAHHRVRPSLQRRTARPRLSPGRSPATAGLYNELLLKSGQDATGQKVSTNLQNAFMYTASILWLLLYLGVQGKLRDAVSAENLQGVARPVVVCIILIMSSVGTVTGFFLKYLDSVRKAVAGAVEVVLATVLFNADRTDDACPFTCVTPLAPLPASGALVGALRHTAGRVHGAGGADGRARRRALLTAGRGGRRRRRRRKRRRKRRGRAGVQAGAVG